MRLEQWFERTGSRGRSETGAGSIDGFYMLRCCSSRKDQLYIKEQDGVYREKTLETGPLKDL